jgi:4-hydroxybenzoyl-CoA thioesterase
MSRHIERAEARTGRRNAENIAAERTARIEPVSWRASAETADQPRPVPPHSASPFVARRRILWGDTDPARIVYTGRFSTFLLDAIENWYHERLGTDWYRLNLDENIGTPFVNVTLDFMSPVTPREDLALTVFVDRIGTTSLTFRVEAHGATTGRLNFVGRATQVFMDNEAGVKCPVPARFRAVLEHEAGLARGAAPDQDATSTRR